MVNKLIAAVLGIGLVFGNAGDSKGYIPEKNLESVIGKIDSEYQKSVTIFSRLVNERIVYDTRVDFLNPLKILATIQSDGYFSFSKGEVKHLKWTGEHYLDFEDTLDYHNGKTIKLENATFVLYD